MRIEGILSEEEEARAREVGARRQTENDRAGRRNRLSERYRESELANHIRGIRTELFVAQCYGVEWVDRPFEERHLPDVSNVDVRASRIGLAVYASDAKNRPFVWVTTANDILCIEGWIWGYEAKRPEWWRADLPYPAFIVPDRALYAPQILPINEKAWV